ncbi:filamentous hemagglutinin family protein [Rhodopseudomonas sp. NSM]|uniref:filamentous haemagglutinin family protein n=1 Tax=Rhodopseudomonas sp. NSM TaxID=3457630 RepID=UPI0040366EB8
MAYRTLLLCGASLFALMVSCAKADARGMNSISSAAPSAAAQEAATAAAAQAAGAAARARLSLDRAAAALAAMRKAQQEAAAIAAQPTLANGSAIPSGVAIGGLMPTGGVTAGNSCGASCTTLQLNAPASFNGASSQLTQTVSDGKTNVNVTQTAKQAIYNWDSFNISYDTRLNFNQQASDWIALNRVNPETSPNLFLQNAAANNGRSNPSYINGQINAPGAVYVINRNGIIFGAGAQINVQSLVASTLDVGKLGDDQGDRDFHFLNTGIGNPFSFSLFDPNGGANSTLIPGNVTVEAGASITARIATDIVPQGAPGFIYLFGANVANYGTLTAPQGEVAMAASRAITLTPGTYSAADFPSRVLPSGVTFRGTGLQLQNYGITYSNGNPSPTVYFRDDVNHIVTGEVTHGGLIETRQGVTTLAGDRVSVGNLLDAAGNPVRDTAGSLVRGVISADTSIDRNSMVLLYAATSVRMDGVISVLPYDDGNTLPTLSGAATDSTSSTVQSFMPAFVEMVGQLDTTIGANGLVSAPSASVSLKAVKLGGQGVKQTRQLFNGNPGTQQAEVKPSLNGAQQVVLTGNGPDGPGATIDVAGLQDVVLPASYNFVSFEPRAEFADMPLQRDGVLYGETLWIDIRASGTRSDGTTWVGTPLADASGYVNAKGRSIYQLMTAGGTVDIGTELGDANGGTTATGRQVVLGSGSVVNVAGGNITYLPGMVPTTRLIGIDGRIYTMAKANPDMIYVGIFGRFTVDHARWGAPESWTLGSQSYQPGYTEGRDAGGVTVTTINPQLNLGNEFYFGSVAGQRQINLGRAPSDLTDYTSGSAVTRPTALQASGDELPSQGYLVLNTPSSVQIGSTPSAHFDTNNALTLLSDETLSSYGLSALSINAYDLVLSSGSAINLAAGGHFGALIGGAIDIAGSITAPGGTIDLRTARHEFHERVFAVPNPDPTQRTADGVLGYVTTAPAPLVAPTSNGVTIGADIFVGGQLDVSGRFVNDTGKLGLDAAGPAFIDGGSISISTTKDSLNRRDTTGSILLAQGSVLDVSSGAYISPRGKLKTAANGVIAGKGGSISLVLYKGTYDLPTNQNNPNPYAPSPGSTQAIVQLDGTLRAYGFESNGSLRLGLADTVRIGGALAAGETSTVKVGGETTIPVALLNDGGFGSYTIESVADGRLNDDDSAVAGTTPSIVVSSNLNLRQVNFADSVNYAEFGTGTKLGSEASQAPDTRLAYLPDDLRKPVDLTLRADNILLDEGASIVTDPQAALNLSGSPNRALRSGQALYDRDTLAQNVLLRGSIVDHGGTLTINAVRTWLDAWHQQQARIDLSGTFIADSRFGLPGGPMTSGTIISGGTLTIESGPLTAVKDSNPVPGIATGGSSYVVAGDGLQVDVSGYAGFISVASGRTISPYWAWGDAGSVSVNSGAFLWNGSFAALGGRYRDAGGVFAADPRANGGTIILGGAPLTLAQSFDALRLPEAPATATGLLSWAQLSQSVGTALTVSAAVDRLAAFENVYLYSGGANGGAARIFNDISGNTATPTLGDLGLQPLTISGALDWSVANRLEIAASLILSFANGSNVAFSAPYVLLTGGAGAASQGTNTLTVTAQTIDVEGAAFAGFRQVNLLSAGDIRLSTPKVANLVDSATDLVKSPSSFSGKLSAYGDILLSGQRIYPVSAVDFTIQSSAGDVTFRAPAGSDTTIPLSAGGSLTVTAANIDQGGNLFAPLGRIVLTGGTGTNADGSPQGVTLRPGSLTSLTLADTIVPYGATSDGTNWYYNSSLNPLTAPPAKGLTLGGASVAVAEGAVIDVRGGGDLQATEWIQGSGGSHDTLTTINGGLKTGSGAGPVVYALVPTSNDSVAAFDIHFTAASRLDAPGQDGVKFTLPSGQVVYLQSGDVYPLAGTQITIAGGGGIAAGTYTLYPAHYATLPGAMRVTYYGDNVGRNVASGTTLMDGTVLVSGQYTQSTSSLKQSSGEALFAVQGNSVWQRYSEYSFNGANAYFTQRAKSDGTVVPRLPIDAGRMAVLAQQQILLAGVALTRPASGGRGGELDIAADKLAVVGHNQYLDKNNGASVPSGYVALDVSQLNNFGFGSILIGGMRSDVDPATGTLITPTATNVLVDTRGEAFAAPEILLVAGAGAWQTISTTLAVGSGFVNVPLAVYGPLPGEGTVTVKSGSIIENVGSFEGGAGRNYYFATPDGADQIAEQIAAALGGTLDSTGTVITGADLTKLNSTWYWNSFHNSRAQAGLSGSYVPGLGALFAATTDGKLSVSGPTGVTMPELTIRFADVRAGAIANVPVSGAVKALDGGVGQVVLPSGDAGSVSIEAGARISAGTVTIQATKSSKAIEFAPGDLHAERLTLAARTIGLGADALAPVSVALPSGAQFDVQTLALKTLLGGAITVYGDFAPGPRVVSLTMDTGAILAASGSGNALISLETGSIALSNVGNSGPPAGLPVANGASLTFAADEVVFGNGAQRIAGYSDVNFVASDGMTVAGTGMLTLGTGTDQVDLSVYTPSVLVTGGAVNGFTFNANGVATFTDVVARSGVTSRPDDSGELGGNIVIIGHRVAVGTTIQAQAGTIVLEATGIDAVNPDGSTAEAVRLLDGAYLAAGGYKQTLVDTDVHVAGGKVLLQADSGGAGSVRTAATSVIDVAQPVDGVGYGGQVQISAVAGRAVLLGELKGQGGPGLGGRFEVDAKSLQLGAGYVDDVMLDGLAARLLAGGLTGAIDIHTRTGNLTLSAGSTLKANAVTLTTDDSTWDSADPSRQFGQITIQGTIDASGYAGATADGSGQAGGQVGLYAANQVTLGGTSFINASTLHSDERGGDVTIGIPWAAAGKIRLQSGMRIDVSGGTKGGLSGGTVLFRAPVDGNSDAKIVAIDAAGNELPTISGSDIHINGARAVNVEGFIAFDTVGSRYGIDGSSLGDGNGVWDGLIDPAGLYDSSGNAVLDGRWTNVTGATIAMVDAGQYQSATATVVLYSGVGIVQILSGVQLVPDGQGRYMFSSTNLLSSIQRAGISASALATVNRIVIAGNSPIRAANFSIQTGSNFTGQTIKQADGTYLFRPDITGLLVFGTYNSASPQTSTGTFIPTPYHAPFFAETLVKFTQGDLVLNGQNYGFDNLISRLSPLAQDLGAGVVHVRPGVELVNSSTSKNAGDITVKQNWNLASGAAYNLQSNGTNGTKYVHTYDNANVAQQSYVTFDYRLVADYGTGARSIEAGALTLRAINDVRVDASISDGFFQFRNYQDSSYVNSLASYLATAQKRGTDPTKNELIDPTYLFWLNSSSQVPVAPYRGQANGISPSSVDLSAADLFPNQLRVCVENCGSANSVGTTPSNAEIVTVTDPGSWSYRLVAGADLASSNPDAVQPLASSIYRPGVTQSNAVRSVIVDKHVSYTQSLYTGAGTTTTTVNLSTMVRTGTGDITVAAGNSVVLADITAPGVIYAAGVNTPRLSDPGYKTVNGAVVVGNTSSDPNQLFFEPQVLLNGFSTSAGTVAYGPPTAAAFPHKGGDVVVDAQWDIVGYSGTGSKTTYQYYKPWLVADAELTPATTAGASSIDVRGQGVFQPYGTSIASQTAWWIQYGSFQQGFLSAGGNVTARAGRDLIDVSISLPTTGRVSGGLTATSTPVTHVYDSGNMVVSAGRDILGGSFYEGSGHAVITAGRSIGATVNKLTIGRLTVDNTPLLAVDLGRIQLSAVGSIAMAGVINPAAQHRQQGSLANDNSSNNNLTPIYMDTYGPDSSVGLMATAGDLVIGVSPTAVAGTGGSAVYPASFEAIATGGDIITTGLNLSSAQFGPVAGMVLSGSEHGEFQLLAQGSIDLTFGVATGAQAPNISAGPALLDKAFDPFRPAAWVGTHAGDSSYGGAYSGAVLAHADDAAIARIYAATGDIVAAAYTDPGSGAINRVEINRPVQVYAGGDITDLNLLAQNIRASDVSSVVAGDDISYTGLNIGGGLQIAGPGFFVVEAGGDLGPFLPVAYDVSGKVVSQQGIISVANASASPVGNYYRRPNQYGGRTGIYNSALLGPSSKQRRNALLGSEGADLVIKFGVKNGINYQGVFDTYVDPAAASLVEHNYYDEMLAFLGRIGTAAGSDPLATFKALPRALQQIFLGEVYVAELKAVAKSGDADQIARGYRIVETMFPTSYGYGDRSVKNNLDLLHATIQTKLGGDISIFGPQGDIIVGSLAPEPNPKLKLSDIGILTLGGGDINTFTDGSVLVNSSRVFTTQGGDILMWSSNGDLDAGRGAKTTLSQPPLHVEFDANDYQSVDLSGFVSGAGIGVLKSSKVARSASLYLLAPRGRIDFGTAGVRSSGEVYVVAPVVVNSGNISAAGPVTGVPSFSLPSLSGSLATSGNAAGAASRTEQPTASGNSGQASIFIVEVVGYGGGDGRAGPAPSSGSETSAPNGAASEPPTGSGTPGSDRNKDSKKDEEQR